MAVTYSPNSWEENRRVAVTFSPNSWEENRRVAVTFSPNCLVEKRVGGGQGVVTISGSPSVMRRTS